MTTFDPSLMPPVGTLAGSNDLVHSIERHADQLREVARALSSEPRSAADEAQHSRMQHWQGVLDLVMGACPEPGGIAFVREGEYWTIGRRHRFRLRDSKGLSYVARLLADPGREYHALDLVSEGSMAPDAPTSSRVTPGTAGFHLDGTVQLGTLDWQAKATYLTRLEELRIELEAAELDHDAGRVASAQAEMEWIGAEISAAYGLSDRPRPGPSPAERARQSVTKAIRVAIGRIEAEDAEIGHHLDRTIRTGTFCSYDPDPAATPRWRL